MYSTCIFCHTSLGANDAVEHFPVGRRLAFDSARGRLWVVCRRCGQWNLTPTDERWEAIEECERLFRGTRLRVSTDQIGLAQLPSGVELVRIGTPERPEFAAWRYGDQLGRRRRSAMLKAGLGVGALGALVVGGVAAGVGIGAFGWIIGQTGDWIVNGSPERVVARIAVDDVGEVAVKRKNVRAVQLLSSDDEGTWRIAIPHRDKTVTLEGQGAIQALARLLPQLNRYGGSRDRVSEAVTLIEREADPLRFFAIAAREARTRESKALVSALPHSMRLALEMAAHEDTERRALEGELELLSHAWKQAEEVAAIADNMLVPAFVDDWMRKHRKG
jgi:hypothetical protein